MDLKSLVQMIQILYKDYKGTLFPDPVPIAIVAIKGKDSTRIIKANFRK